MNLRAADRKIIRNHSIRNLREDYREIFIARTGLEVKDVQEKPEILNLMLKKATEEGGRFWFTSPALSSPLMANDLLKPRTTAHS